MLGNGFLDNLPIVLNCFEVRRGRDHGKHVIGVARKNTARERFSAQLFGELFEQEVGTGNADRGFNVREVGNTDVHDDLAFSLGQHLLIGFIQLFVKV